MAGSVDTRFAESLKERLEALKVEIAGAQARMAELSAHIAGKQGQVEHILDLLRSEGVAIDRTDLLGIIPVSLAEVVSKILRETGGPLHYKELAGRVEDAGFRIQGKNPDATLLALLHRYPDGFATPERGMWALSEWNLPKKTAPRRGREKVSRAKRDA
jgi:hypothetical protein